MLASFQSGCSSLLQSPLEALFHMSLETIGNYAKFNVGKRTRQSMSSEDDDQFSDILLLIDILSNLLSKDYLDLSPGQ